MLVGPAGSGKSVLMSDSLKRLPADDYAVTQIAFNFYTTSIMLQNMMEKPLEKKSGRCYGPVGNKRMIYFLDDMNMPEVKTVFLFFSKINFPFFLFFQILKKPLIGWSCKN
jgi:dynein heavy chain, axonemal